MQEKRKQKKSKHKFKRQSCHHSILIDIVNYIVYNEEKRR